MRSSGSSSSRFASALASSLVLLLPCAAARADVVSDIRRAYKRDEAPERVAALRAVRGGIAGADRKLRNKSAAAIEKALKKEPVPSVRVASLDLLLLLRTDRALDRLVMGVLDRKPKVAAHVHEIVRTHADSRLQAAVVRAMKNDASWRARAAMVDLLLSGARAGARMELVAALRDEHPAVAARASEALERLTGKSFGLDAEMWKAYLEALAKEEAAHAPGRTTAEPMKRVEVHEGPIRGLLPTLYTIPISEKRVIFVVDMSSSMQKTSRSSHFTELKRALFGLPSDVHFNVLCFDERLFFYAKAKSLVPATAAHKAKVERWINDLPAGRRTDVNRSIITGLAMLREALRSDGKMTAELFILTDGFETKKTTSLRAVEAHYQKLPQERCRIHVIALGKSGTPALRVLADESGGKFVEAGAR